MIVKDFLPVIISALPNIRILSNANNTLKEEYSGNALDTPYRFLGCNINLIRATGGVFEIHIIGSDNE